MVIAPMLLDETNAPYESKHHIAELKVDRIRGVLGKTTCVRMFSRHQKEMMSRFSELMEAADRAIGQHTTLDGEVVVCDPGKGSWRSRIPASFFMPIEYLFNI